MHPQSPPHCLRRCPRFLAALVAHRRQRLLHQFQVLFVVLPLLSRQRQAAPQRGAGGAALEAQPVVRGIELVQPFGGLFQGGITGRQAALGEAVL